MTAFRLIVTAQATLEAIAAKRWRLVHLGSERARELDDSIARTFDPLQAFPESASRELYYYGYWTNKRRKTAIGETGYVLRYRLHVRAELIEVFSIRHQSSGLRGSSSTRAREGKRFYP